MILTKNNKYEGDFIDVDVKKEGEEMTITIFGRYTSEKQYLILGEKKKLSEKEYLEFVKSELETIKVMIDNDYGKQN